MSEQAERVLLVLELDGAGPDNLNIRLRHLLKAMVRRFGLRCCWQQDVGPDWRFGQQLQQDVTMGREPSSEDVVDDADDA